jgi:hypothetical protein
MKPGNIIILLKLEQAMIILLMFIINDQLIEKIDHVCWERF